MAKRLGIYNIDFRIDIASLISSLSNNNMLFYIKNPEFLATRNSNIYYLDLEGSNQSSV
jgi:hypothetical protein